MLNDVLLQTPVPVIFEGICLGPNEKKKECKKRLESDCEVKNQGSSEKNFNRDVISSI